MEEALSRTQSEKRARSWMLSLEVRLLRSCLLKAGIGPRGSLQGVDSVGKGEYFQESEVVE